MTAKRKSAASQKQKAVKLGPRFLRAFTFAAEKHAGQTRKASTTPYIAHLMGVVSLTLEFGGDEDLAIAALAARAHRAGVPVLVDGAQAVGIAVVTPIM